MTVCLLLAAGNSSRMGQPKMLLDFKGKTFLQHIIDEVKTLRGASLLVVTGCYHDMLKPVLESQQIPFIKNTLWQEGMGSSIREGIKRLQQHNPDAGNVIVLVCDQPHISAAVLQQMINAKQTTGKGIVACSYDGTTGTPVLFDKKYFSQLSLLQGTSGAKKMIQQFNDDVDTINFPEGAIDIDTPEDYNKLR